VALQLSVIMAAEYTSITSVADMIQRRNNTTAAAAIVAVVICGDGCGNDCTVYA